MLTDYDQVNKTIKVMFQENGFERHYTLSDEGLIIDVIVDGEIVNTRAWDHHLLSDDPDDNFTDASEMRVTNKSPDYIKVEFINSVERVYEFTKDKLVITFLSADKCEFTSIWDHDELVGNPDQNQ